MTEPKTGESQEQIPAAPSAASDTLTGVGQHKSKGYSFEFLRANLGNLLVLTGSVMFVLLPQYLQSQEMSKWEIGLVDGAFWFISIFIQPWLGPRLDKDGRKIYLVGGSLVMALAATSYAFIPATLFPMLIARLIHGFGFACYLTASWTWVADYSPPNRLGEFFGIFGISGMFAGALGPGVAEYIKKSHDYDDLFFSGAGVIFVGWLCLITVSDRRPETGPLSDQPGFFRLLRSKAMRGMVTGSIAFGIAMGSIFAFIAPYLDELKVEGVGTLFACTTIASGASRIFAGHLTDRLGPVKMVAPALLMLAAGTVGLAQAPFVGPDTIVPILIGSGLAAGLGYGIVYPALNAVAVKRLSAASRGRGLCLVTAAVDCGSTLGAASAGLVAHYYGYSWGFRTIGVLVLILLILFVVLEKKTLGLLADE